MVPLDTWFLPRPRSDKYQGGFPLHFEKRLIELVGYKPKLDKKKIFHPFGGKAEYGIRNDLNLETLPHYSMDAHNLTEIENESYGLVILDPPYNKKYSEELYEMPAPNYSLYSKEAVRVCKEGGYICVYHWVMTPRPENCRLIYIIVILTRVWHRPRICCIFRKDIL